MAITIHGSEGIKSDDTTNDVIIERESTNGNIVTLQKDGTTVGSIASVDGDISIGSGDTKIRFFDSGDQLFPTTDNLTTLGRHDSRFKDAYLSGGVYLGGTGSANYLDDYEEGTWTPAFAGNSSGYVSSYTSRYGYYTKVGRIVHVWGAIRINVYGGGITDEPCIKGLPFSVVNTTSYTHPMGAVQFWAQPNALPWNIGGENTRLFFRQAGTTGDTYPNASTFGSGTNLSFSITYHTS